MIEVADGYRIVGDSDSNNSPTRVGTVIVNYNAGDYLIDCIDRILPQVDRVIVVDNCSSDNSLNLLSNSFTDGARVRVIRNPVNLGFSEACNIGIDKANDLPYVLFLNPDCLLEDNAVEEMLQTFRSVPKLGMVGGLLLNPDGSEQAGGRRAVPTPWRSFVRAFGLTRFANRWPRLFEDFHLHAHPLPERPIEVEAISGACMLVRRQAMQDVGLWDEGYFLHCEDLDLCMRFRQKGWKVMFAPSARMVHIHGASSKDRKLFVEWHKHKGMLRFYRKFFHHQYPGILMWLVIFGVWLRFAMIAVAHAGRKLLRKLGITRA
jgi:GT2 family glycosyltransferase